MFRWLSRKGGVQAGYTRVIDLRHPKILGSNRASMNSPFFSLSLFSLLSLSPFPRLIAAIVLVAASRLIGGILSIVPSALSLRSASVSNLEIPRISNFQRGYARVKTVRPNEWPWSRPCTQRPRFLTLDWHGWIGLNEASSRRLLSRMRNVTRARNLARSHPALSLSPSACHYAVCSRRPSEGHWARIKRLPFASATRLERGDILENDLLGVLDIASFYCW